MHTVSPPHTPLRKHLLSGIKHCKIWREGFFFVVCEECCCVGIFGGGGRKDTCAHLSDAQWAVWNTQMHRKRP